MSTLIVLFNLKEGVTASDYEKFAKEIDVPTVSALKSIDDFKVFKTSGVLGAPEVKPPYQYCEIIDVNDMERLFEDISTEKMQKIAAQFQGFADNPMFIVSEQFA
jgi:REDY-like protein HapK